MGGDRIHLLPSCNSLWLPNSPCAPSLQGANSLEEELETLEMPLAQAIVKGENEQEEEEEEELDMCLPQPTKKRRLTSRQLEFLEANFALENKLEPERKLRLAVEIGLQPRQVAIWFQNRRARFKNKQLEKDYDSLKGSFEKLKAEFECLVKEKKSFESEVSSLKGKLASREKGLLLETLEPLEYYYPQSTTPREEIREGEKPCKLPVGTKTPKQEDASSAKSDVFDSDSPLSLLGPDHSDHFTQNEEEDHQLQHPFGSCFLSSSPPKHCLDPSPDSSNYGFPVEDQPFWNLTTYHGDMYY